MAIQSRDETVKEQAIKFADQIKQAAEFAEKEEEIRIEAERALAVIQREAGIVFRGRHEYTIGTGRVDSVYGCVIIEYKNPHDPASRLSAKKESKGNQEVIKQIKNRFLDFRKEQKQPMNAMFGVGCDGNYFIFVRSRDEKWYVEDPVEVNKYSAERFLWALINMGTKGKSFSPEYLSGDFGSESLVAQEGVRSFYNTICTTKSLKAQAFFQQWKILFGEVCGYDVDTPSDKIIELSSSYGIESEPKPAELLFSIHTYYAIFMKLLASEVVAFFHKLPTPLQKILTAPTTNKLREEMTDLERGSIFRHFNITNFLEGDIFLWYIDAYSWNDSIEKTIRKMANCLADYNPGTLSEDSSGSRDLLKKLYQELFPKSLRHDLGEYYTPDWLAEHVLNGLDYAGDPDKRLLDPACGSGTFLVMAINRIRKWYDQNRELCSYDEGELARKILNNVVGFDLNPLAVMAARTNYLISMRDLIGRVGSFEIPVYLCDSIMTPAEYGGIDSWTTGKKVTTKELITSVAKFRIPLDIGTNRQNIAKYSEQLEFCVENGYETDEFIQRCEDEGLTISARDMHANLYQELVRLKRENKNSVWARIIKNAFAPLFCGKFDYIAGNPPWINWTNLPDNYRTQTIDLWKKYGLVTIHSSMERLGGSSKDISTLFVYSAIDSYLVENGKLGFVITQTVFKNPAADEFRNFSFRSNDIKINFKIERVHDMVDLDVFEGASNRTSTFTSTKGLQTEYPVDYITWHSTNSRIHPDLPLSTVMERISLKMLKAYPADPSKNNSRWITIDECLKIGLSKLSGKSGYRARLGVKCDMNGVYYLELLQNELQKDGTILIRNLPQTGRNKKIAQKIGRVHRDFLYPLISGRNVRRWKAIPEGYWVVPHTRRTGIKAIEESIMKREYPSTYEFLGNFRNELANRPILNKWGKNQPFYAVFDIGPYTFSDYRVIWREQIKDFSAAVLEIENVPIFGLKILIPNHKLMLVDVGSKIEAYYLAGSLNSSPIRCYINSMIIGTQIGTDVLSFVDIPLFDAKNPIHRNISELAEQCHAATINGETELLTNLECEVDKASAKLWNLTESELDLIQNALNEL